VAINLAPAENHHRCNFHRGRESTADQFLLLAHADFKIQALFILSLLTAKRDCPVGREVLKMWTALSKNGSAAPQSPFASRR
jgi:hypothetical protein